MPQLTEVLVANELGFFYVDGIPTKGLWVDLDDVQEWGDVLAPLVEHKLCTADYGGDVLCADTEGDLAKHFIGAHGGFHLNGFIQARDCRLDSEVVSAWLDNGMVFDRAQIDECYRGKFESWKEFAWSYLEDSGSLDRIPQDLRGYFDIETYARDLQADFFESNGHYFWSC